MEGDNRVYGFHGTEKKEMEKDSAYIQRTSRIFGYPVATLCHSPLATGIFNTLDNAPSEQE
jgi:hypothetical protein